MNLTAGSRLGPYEITALIGEGGMGQVYRATDTNLGRHVAIKVLPAACAADPERLARFEREARTLASLNHPNIAIIHGLDRSGGQPALVMELVEGPTLAELIDRRAGPSGPAGLPLDEALPIARQIVDALEAAHEHGIVHRDLKPANIKVRDDGTVKVLDFGLAKALGPPEGGHSDRGVRLQPDLTASPTITSPAMMTGVGTILGTAAYMSPEQARGRPVDRRADIWAFGCVLYEMLTGRRAFEDEDVSMTLSKVLQREPDFDALPAGVPARVRQTVRLCLRKTLRERIPDMGAVRLALEGAFEMAEPQPAQAAVAARPWWRRALPVAAAVLATLVAAGAAVALLRPGAAPGVVHRFTHTLPPDQTFRGGGRTVVALSRDGRHVVYNATGGLFLRSMDAVDARVIPGTEAVQANPFFSPDGESVGYFEAGQLKRIGINGGAPVTVCAATAPFGASWESDGTILFGQSNGIMRVSASGGTPQLVIPAKQGEQVYGPQLLPDGDSVLFSVTTATGTTRWDQADIVVQSLRTGERRVVLKGGSDARYVRPGHLVYAVRDALFALAFDAGRLEVSGGPVSVLNGLTRSGNPVVNTASAQYDVSDGGTLVYVASGDAFAANIPLGTLVWVDRQGREEALAAPPRNYVYPRLSPEGTRVALDIRDGEQDIWIWDLGRQTMTRLTFDPQLDGLPVWTPDGRRLVWASQRAGPLNLFWQAADGSGTVERLTNSPNAQRASGFSPDGQRVVVSEGAPPQPGQDIGMMLLAGDRRVTPLVQTAYTELNPEVSPDGRWLAYESNESGQFQIYVRPFPATDEGRWQVSTAGGEQPVWARSGRELFYVAPDGSLMGVPVIPGQGGRSFTAGTPVKLVSGDGYWTAINTANLGRTYDVSFDGQRFLRIKPAASADSKADLGSLVIVQNWVEELKRLVPTN